MWQFNICGITIIWHNLLILGYVIIEYMDWKLVSNWIKLKIIFLNTKMGGSIN
jgi:hypothetical protein